MADTDTSIQNLSNQFEKLNNSAEESSKSDEKAVGDQNRSSEKWGFSLKDLYKLGLKFYKDNEGKAVSLSYQDKLRLVAFRQQVSHGPFDPLNTQTLGVLDVIGRDRQNAWQCLGDMSQDNAMKQFIELLEKSASTFQPFVEAQRADKEARRRAEEEERGRREEEEVERGREQEERTVAEERKRQVQEALNEQTYLQFRAYAEEQFPGNPEQQAVLIRQLQEQHYHQYMQQLVQQAQFMPNIMVAGEGEEGCVGKEGVGDGGEGEEGVAPEEGSEDEVIDGDGLPKISPPSMWTRKDIKDFKESIRKEGGDAIIKVGHGETVTVRVPTHEDGSCLFWEFATDGYDIGFGVFFEWTKSPTSQVSVHIQDSEEEEDVDDDDIDEDDEELAEFAGASDIERGSHLTKLNDKDRPLMSAVVPIYRRDCQDEVYAGSHVYPGEGVYLLKFDNSYSLWRSKTLYYRVYYTR